jgi:hypothetical protein
LPFPSEDKLLPYLLNDDLLFVTQKTDGGTLCSSCFKHPETTLSIDEETILYDRLWEAFRIYPEEWARILSFTCLDGPFKRQFNVWLSCHDFTELNFDGFGELFGSVENEFGIDWVLRNIHQRLKELKRVFQMRA